MRFKKMIDGLVNAMVHYCIQYDFTSGFSESELENLETAAYRVLGSLPDAEMKEYAVFSYHFFTNDGRAEEIFPEYIKENGILCEQAIHLATFPQDSFTMAGDTREISSAYDLIYDVEDESIRLLYRLMIADSEMTTIYRVDVPEDTDFDSYQFFMDTVARLSEKVKHNRREPEQELFHEREAA